MFNNSVIPAYKITTFPLTFQIFQQHFILTPLFFSEYLFYARKKAVTRL